MELGVGARALGMGSAFTSLSEDATSFYWNPAGIAKLDKNELFVMHSENFAGEVKYNTLSYANNSVGIAFSQVGYDSILIDTLENDTLNPEPEGIINIVDYVFYLSYANKISEDLFWGINLKGIWRDWLVGSAYGFGTDFGILYSAPGGLAIGLNIENVGGTYLIWSTGTREYILPLLRTGISSKWDVSLIQGEITFAMGLDTDIENRITELELLHSDTHIGVEYWYKNKERKRIIALRLGKDKGNNCLGIGLIYKNFKIDYALQFHELGTKKRLSGSVTF